MNWQLDQYDLRPIGFDIKLYLTALGVDLTFLKRQYEYSRGGTSIHAKAGDVVIDAGSCYGDTALYFAHQVGPQGRVFGFEFIGENLEILNRNLELNPPLSKRIEVVEAPLWETSGKVLYCVDNGPSSRVSDEPTEGAQEIKTLSIDDLVCSTESLSSRSNQDGHRGRGAFSFERCCQADSTSQAYSCCLRLPSTFGLD